MKIRTSTKKISTLMLVSAITVALVMMVANDLVLRQVREEAARQAGVQLETSLRVFRELVRQKGSGFRIGNGTLAVGPYVFNGNCEIPDAVLSLTGCRATVFMGNERVATNVILPDGRRAIGTRLAGPAYDAVIRRGVPYRGEVPILGVPYFTAYDPVRDDRGRTVGALFVGIRQEEYLSRYHGIRLKVRAINITLASVFVLLALLLLWERRLSERALQKQFRFLQLLTDTIPSPIFVKDAAGRYDGCNEAFESFVGFSRQELLGRTMWAHWPRRIAEQDQETDRVLLEKGGSQAYESRVTCADGCMRDVIFNKALFRDQEGQPAGIVGVILDITGRKAAEVEIRRAAEENSRLEAQMHHSRLLASLMAQLSHDLNTPLTPLFALLPMIRERVGDPQLERMLDICQESAGRIREIAMKSLDLLRVFSTATHPELSPVDLAGTAEYALGEASATFAERGIACRNRIDGGVLVAGAADQLALLFKHLLSNAARHAAEGGTVLIDAVVRDGGVQVSVRDDGAGLHPDRVSLVFNELYKGDASQDLTPHGLGLAICQRIVLNHGERIWAESPGPGAGTTIHFTLKLAPHPQHEASTS